MKELKRWIDQYSGIDGIHETAIGGLRCLSASSAGGSMPTVYKPSLCVIVEGVKTILLEEEIYRYERSEFLAVSVDLPVVGQVLEAPYLCLQLDLESNVLGEFVSQMGKLGVMGKAEERGVFVGRVDEALLESLERLVRLLGTPQDIPMLGPMAIREVYYRLLTGAHGNRIAQMAVADSRTQRIGRAIERLKQGFAEPVRVEDLAQLAHMSPSSFHQHFKEVTAMSPLQFQKRLRLMEARRILLSEGGDAAGTAYRVGYESASQFSREYARMFGAPPMRDVEALRLMGLSI